jgi:hypothetical protein
LSLGNMFRPLRSSIDMQFGLSSKRTTLVTWGDDTKITLFNRLISTTSQLTIGLVLLQMLMMIFILGGAVFGLIGLALEKEFLIFSVIFMVLIYFLVLSGGPEAYARFRVPIIPLLAIACGHGFKIALRFRRK